MNNVYIKGPSDLICKISRGRKYSKYFFFNKYEKLWLLKGRTFSQRYWNTRFVCSRVSLTSWGEGAHLALVRHPSSDGVTIKIPYQVDLYYIDLPCTPSFPVGLFKTKSDFVLSVEPGLGRWTLTVAVISVHAYRFTAFSDMTCYSDITGIGVFWMCHLMVRRPNLEAANKALLHQQVTTPR